MVFPYIQQPTPTPTPQSAPPVPQPTDDDTLSIDEVISDIETSSGLPKGFLKALKQRESKGGQFDEANGGHVIASPTGPRGVFQFSRRTAAAYGINPDDPVENVIGAAKYAKDNYKRLRKNFNSDDEAWVAAALAHNRGAGAVEGMIRNHSLEPTGSDGYTSSDEYAANFLDDWMKLRGEQSQQNIIDTPIAPNRQRDEQSVIPTPTINLRRSVGGQAGQVVGEAVNQPQSQEQTAAPSQAKFTPNVNYYQAPFDPNRLAPMSPTEAATEYMRHFGAQAGLKDKYLDAFVAQAIKEGGADFTYTQGEKRGQPISREDFESIKKTGFAGVEVRDSVKKLAEGYLKAQKSPTIEPYTPTLAENYIRPAERFLGVNTQEGIKTTAAEELARSAIDTATFGAVRLPHVSDARIHNERERQLVDLGGQVGNVLGVAVPFAATSHLVASALRIPALASLVSALEESGAAGRALVRGVRGAATFGGVQAGREITNVPYGESKGLVEAAKNIGREAIVGGVSQGLTPPEAGALRAGATFAGTAAGADVLEGKDLGQTGVDALKNLVVALALHRDTPEDVKAEAEGLLKDAVKSQPKGSEQAEPISLPVTSSTSAPETSTEATTAQARPIVEQGEAQKVIAARQAESGVGESESKQLRGATESSPEPTPVQMPKELRPLAEAVNKYDTAKEFAEAHTQAELVDLSNRDMHRFGRAISPYAEDASYITAKSIQNDPLLEDLRLSNPDVHSVIANSSPTMTIYRAVPADRAQLIAKYEAQKREILRRGKIQPSNRHFSNSSEQYEWLGKEIERLEAQTEGDAKRVIEVGDYVAPARRYAVEHGESNLHGEYTIIRKTVPKQDVLWDGADFEEWVYSPQRIRDYARSLPEFYEKVKSSQTVKGSGEGATPEPVTGAGKEESKSAAGGSVVSSPEPAPVQTKEPWQMTPLELWEVEKAEGYKGGGSIRSNRLAQEYADKYREKEYTDVDPGRTTLRDYLRASITPKTPYNRGGYPADVAREDHRAFVEERLARGESVPPEVLADYPDLAETSGVSTSKPAVMTGQEAGIETPEHHSQTQARRQRNTETGTKGQFKEETKAQREARQPEGPLIDRQRYQDTMMRNGSEYGIDSEADIPPPEEAYQTFKDEYAAVKESISEYEAQLQSGKRLRESARRNLEAKADNARERLAYLSEHAENLFGERAAKEITGKVARETKQSPTEINTARPEGRQVEARETSGSPEPPQPRTVGKASGQDEEGAREEKVNVALSPRERDLATERDALERNTTLKGRAAKQAADAYAKKFLALHLDETGSRYVSPQMRVTVGGKDYLVNTSPILESLGTESVGANRYKLSATPKEGEGRSEQASDSRTVQNPTPESSRAEVLSPRVGETTKLATDRLRSGVQREPSEQRSVPERAVSVPQAVVENAAPRVTGAKGETGIKNEVKAQERAERDLPPVEVEGRRSFGQAWESAKERIERGEVDPSSLAKEIVAKPRPLSIEESAALVQDAVRIRNADRATQAEIEDAQKAGDVDREAGARARLKEIEEARDLNDKAARASGYEQGLGLAARRMMAKDDYSLSTLKQRAKIANGGEIPETVRARLETLSKQIEEMEAKLVKKDEAYAKLKAERSIEKMKREDALEGRRQRRQVNKADLDKEFSELSTVFGQKASKLHSGIDPELAVLIGKMAKNRVKAGINTVDGIVDEIHAKLKDYVEDKRDIRDAISGYGQESEMSKDDVSVRLRELKRQMRLASAIEDAESGEKPLKSGLRREPESQRVRSMRRELQAALRKSGLDREPLPPKQNRPRISEIGPKQGPKEWLSGAKKRLQKQIDDLESQLKTKEFAKVKARTPLVYDREGEGLKIKRDDLRRQADAEIRRLERANRGNGAKLGDFIIGLRRAILLSSVKTIGKLTAAASGRAITTPIEEAVGSVLPSGARYRGFNPRAEKAALSAMFSRGMLNEAWGTLTGGESLATRYGGKSLEDPEVLNLFGRIHGALKSPAKYSEFFRAVEQRSDGVRSEAIKHGMSAKEADAYLERPEVQAGITAKAYEDAQAAILMQDNAVTNFYRMGLAYARSKGPLGRATARAGEFVFPIVKIPTNFVFESTSYAAGGGKALASILWNKGIKTPEQADYVTKNLQKQALGAVLLAIGYWNADSIGGYYQRGDKRSDKDPKAGGAKLFGYDVPRWLLHTPALEMLQIGATVRRVKEAAEAKSEKKGTEPDQPVTSGLWAGAKGLVSEIPFFEEVGRISSLENWQGVRKFGGELTRSAIIPPDVQAIARSGVPFTRGTMGDVGPSGEPVKRKSSGFFESIEEGIPFARRNINISPVFGTKATKGSDEVQRLGITVRGVEKKDGESRAEYVKRRDEMNPSIGRAIDETVSSPDYNKLSDEEKRKAIQQVIRDAAEGRPSRPYFDRPARPRREVRPVH